VWGRAVADVTVLFDYFDFDPVPEGDHDRERWTRRERLVEWARNATSQWRRYFDAIAERLRPVLRVAVALVIILSGLATLLGVGIARTPFALSCVTVVATVVTRRLLARRRAREAARRRAEARAAYTLIEGPRRVPVDVLRLRDGAVSSLRPETLEALRG
jgi:hypothetical protein